MSELKCIKEVCKMLDMTPRTIWYYEQRGLVKTVRESKTALRRLDADNIERLRKIRFLRRLGSPAVPPAMQFQRYSHQCIHCVPKESVPPLLHLWDRRFLLQNGSAPL